MKSFLHGKKSLAIPALRLPAALAAPHAHGRPGSRTSHAAPIATSSAGINVEVVKEGDKVARLVVTCTCGERIEIECIYPAGV